MIVKIGDQEYKVQWMHVSDNDTTSCVIRKWNGTEWEVISSSIVKRYYLDTPNVFIACSYSLAYALRSAFGKDDRRLFFEEFLSRRSTGLLIE